MYENTYQRCDVYTTNNTLTSSTNKLFNPANSSGRLPSIQSDRVHIHLKITDLFNKHLNNNKESINLGSIIGKEDNNSVVDKNKEEVPLTSSCYVYDVFSLLLFHIIDEYIITCTISTIPVGIGTC